MTAVVVGTSGAAPLFAAEVTSQSCARWEANFRALVLQAGLFLLLTVFLLAWLAPFLMRAAGRFWRWALGVTGRSLWPGIALGLLALFAWLLFVLPGPWRTQLAAMQIQHEYFPAPPSPSPRPSVRPGSGAAVGTATAKSAARAADCTNVNFAKRGLLFGVGGGETLGAQPFLILGFLLSAAAAGALLARGSYALAARLRAPWARARRAAREGRGAVR